MKRAAVAFALAAGLTACSSISDAEFADQALDLVTAELIVDWQAIPVPGAPPQSSGAIAAAEKSAWPALESACLTPNWEVLNSELMRYPGLLQLASSRGKFEYSAVACFREKGFNASLIWKSRRLGELSTVEMNRQTINLLSRPRASAGRFFWTSGCGSRGGPGYRLANGKCASWKTDR